MRLMPVGWDVREVLEKLFLNNLILELLAMINNILVINTGSTSLKYKLFDLSLREIKKESFFDVSDHEKILKRILREIGDISSLRAVGHRVVHGGENFKKSILIDDKNLAELEGLNDLAPLHNPYNLLGIKILREFLPITPQIAVFDTAFFADMPEKSTKYAISDNLSKKYKIKKYGFHGISHQYIAEEAAKKLGSPLSKLNLITCHLGGGWSVAAIKNGRAIDTSMGFTPSEGLVMMTRAGDIGLGAIFNLLEEGPGSKNDINKLYHELNFESGIKAISGGIDDYQKLLKEINLGNKKAKLAFDMATYRLLKYIGAYYVALSGKLDALVFSGAIGSGDPITRNEIIKNTKFLGNYKNLSIETNEEFLIAKEVLNFIEQ